MEESYKLILTLQDFYWFRMVGRRNALVFVEFR